MPRLTLFLYIVVTSVTAFTYQGVSKPTFARSLSQETRPKTAQHATVYNFEDDGSLTSVWDETFPSFSPTFSPEPFMAGFPIPETIRQNLAALTRLAAAFSPNRIALQNIHQVNIRHFDGRRLQLEAVVCDSVECVTLDIPVVFNDPCYMDSSIDACMLHNINSLDMNAIQILKRHEVENEYEARVDELACEPTIFPNWWIAPKQTQVIDECQNILSLLNDSEFAESIQGVAVMALLEAGEDMNVEYATVAAVGPAGLIVRALARTAPLHPGASPAPLEFIKVPVPFSSLPNENDPHAVRDSVLALVAMATDYMP